MNEKKIRTIAEYATFKRLITEVYPNSLISIVSDTFDLFSVLTNIIPKLKKEILARDGKVVIRPDSGNPVDIICGLNSKYKEPNNTYKEIHENSPEYKGVIELLWDTFGGTINSKGYKVLDSHIGAIYGDSITLERANAMCERLEAKGFASSNIVLGIGSFSYQLNSRDVYGFAMKATYGELREPYEKYHDDHGNSQYITMYETIGREIYKDPITDSGTKKSLKGLVSVHKDNGGKYYVKDQQSWEEENIGELELIYEDGKFIKEVSLSEIRDRI